MEVEDVRGDVHVGSFTHYCSGTRFNVAVSGQNFGHNLCQEPSAS